MDVVRLDRFLSEMGADSRSEIKKNIRKGYVMIDGRVINNPAYNADESDTVNYKDRVYTYSKYQYFMLNKPAGLLSATVDKKQPTVIDLFRAEGRKDLFPVGRLDKDTVGLLLVTNDGELAHRLLSPKCHVPKTYFARLDRELEKEDVTCFSKGLKISEDFKALPARLEILDDGYSALVTVFEGKFHQVKRMFEAVGKNVIYLKRISIGGLKLDENLDEGKYRPLTADETKKLKL